MLASWFLIPQVFFRVAVEHMAQRMREILKMFDMIKKKKQKTFASYYLNNGVYWFHFLHPSQFFNIVFLKFIFHSSLNAVKTGITVCAVVCFLISGVLTPWMDAYLKLYSICNCAHRFKGQIVFFNEIYTFYMMFKWKDILTYELMHCFFFDFRYACVTFPDVTPTHIYVLPVLPK